MMTTNWYTWYNNYSLLLPLSNNSDGRDFSWKRNKIGLKKIINFDLFITKDVMTAVYVLGAIFLTFCGVFIAVWGIHDQVNFKKTAEAFTMAIIFLVPLNIVWRLVCEYIVVIFKINESLMYLNSKLEPDNK